MKQWQSILTVAAALVLGLSVSAWAHGGGEHPGGPGGPGGLGGGPDHGGAPAGIKASGLLRELINPCPAACFDAQETCNDAARATAVSCGQAACPTQIEAAQTACASGGTIDACKTARDALNTCVADCATALSTATSTCRTELRTCLTSCSTTTP